MKPTLPIKSLIRLNWLLVVAFPAIIALYLFFMLQESLVHKLFYTAMTAFGVGLVGFVNVGILVLLARKYGTKSTAFRRYRYLLTYMASGLIYLALAPLFDYMAQKNNLQPYPVFLCIIIASSGVVNTAVIFLQDFIFLQSDKASAELENARLKTAHAEGTILLLKQQIHPHFLFNALNTLKALYRKDPGAGDTYIVHLANFLRASVFDHAQKMSELDGELTLLKDYLAMQKIRFGNALTCIIDIPEEKWRGSYLPSFSLQPLLENAIKHNELTLQAPLIVRIYYREDYIVVENNLQRKRIKGAASGHGLSNLSERYRLLSGEELFIEEDKHKFSVSIKLLTHEYSDHRG